MKFAIFSNGQRLTQPLESFEEDLREIVVADQLGFEEAWISEHTAQPWLPMGLPAPELFANAAALTQHIRLGPAVRRIALYPPQMVAIEGAVCDHLTGGRYMLGFGVGPKLTNYEQWGIDPGQASAMTVEAIELIRRCWSEPAPFDFAGDYFRGRGIAIYPKPLQSSIPIAVATANEKMLDRAARDGFRVLTTWSSPVNALCQIGAQFDAACLRHRGARQRSDLVACRAVYVAQTDERANRHVADNFRKLLAYNRQYLEPSTSPLIASRAAPPELTFERMVEGGHIIVGSPATVIESIKRLYRDIGGFGTFMLVAGRDFATPKQIEDMYHLFAETVRPALLDLDLEQDPEATSTIVEAHRSRAAAARVE